MMMKHHQKYEFPFATQTVSKPLFQVSINSVHYCCIAFSLIPKNKKKDVSYVLKPVGQTYPQTVSVCMFIPNRRA